MPIRIPITLHSVEHMQNYNPLYNVCLAPSVVWWTSWFHHPKKIKLSNKLIY